jgi:hypothetical protein
MGFQRLCGAVWRGKERDGPHVVKPVGQADGQDGLFEKSAGLSV